MREKKKSKKEEEKKGNHYSIFYIGTYEFNGGLFGRRFFVLVSKQIQKRLAFFNNIERSPGDICGGKIVNAHCVVYGV